MAPPPPPQPELVFGSSPAKFVLAGAFTGASVLLGIPMLGLAALDGHVLVAVVFGVLILLGLVALWRAARSRIELRAEELVVVGVFESATYHYRDILQVESQGALGGVTYQLAGGNWKRLPSSPFNVVSDPGRVQRIPEELQRRVEVWQRPASPGGSS